MITREEFKSLVTAGANIVRTIRAIENINNLFGLQIYGANDKPTNGELIALIADKMIMGG